VKETTVSTKKVFKGNALALEVIEVEIEPGVRGKREIVRHMGAVAVLARRADGQFVFVRQFRKAVEEEVLEVVAGCLDEGEDPVTCAARELTEETGYRAERISGLGKIWTSPGYTDEEIHVFVAELAEDQGEPCPDKDERLVVMCMGENEVEERIAGGAIRDGKSLATWLLWKNGRRCE
jgi:ADP-ribose pyrophosphatase